MVPTLWVVGSPFLLFLLGPLIRCPMTAVCHPGGVKTSFYRPPFLGPSPCGAGRLSLNRAAWSLKELPKDAIVSGFTSDDHLQ